MAHITDDRVLESTTTVGTGALTLAGALTGFRTFAAAQTVGDTCWYALWAVDASGNPTGDFESGLGTYSAASTLTRTTVLRSSNANAVVTLAAGTKYVAISALASRTLQLDNELAMVMPAITVTNESAAPTGTLKLFARNMAGRMTPRYIGPAGADTALQDKISEAGSSFYLPNGGAAAGLNIGVNWNAGGTLSHPTLSTAAPAIYNSLRRSRFENIVTTTNQSLGVRTTTANKRYWRGNAAGLGGFNFHARFAIGSWAADTVRLFVGLNDSNVGWTIADVLTGSGCGLWHDTTEAGTVLSFVTRDGTTATKAPITLGSALAAGQVFDFWMAAAPNGGSISYRLVDLVAGIVRVDTTTTTTLPINTAMMGQELAMSNGTANIVVSTVAFELAGHSCQSDF
jgi:hypothetical protein